MGNKGEIMNKIILLALALTSCKTVDSTLQVSNVGNVTNFGVQTEVFDVRYGDRTCMVFATKFGETPQDVRFFFHCPQK